MNDYPRDTMRDIGGFERFMGTHIYWYFIRLTHEDTITWIRNNSLNS